MNRAVGLTTDPGLLPFTVPEVQRLLWRLVWEERSSVDDILAWSGWRRRHQARARQSHWRRHLQYMSEVRL
jgi:hypothetical protein